ncbi:hypothetical protein NHX12_033924 [Muraenolepis orangiensis]|uniref:E3 ubiquitin ligase TRAF3IP2 n=1 Tax=Muraenolepis orangiensis TaxID=630683 RepID=A0A9Q0E8M3_9TELE|nr:hypothetical protein NHX12_033924 [Muraenolepis orangiensis]
MSEGRSLTMLSSPVQHPHNRDLLTVNNPDSPDSHGCCDNGGRGDLEPHAHRPAHFLSDLNCGSFPPAQGYAHRCPHPPTPFPSRLPDGSWGPSFAGSSGWTGSAAFPGGRADSCPVSGGRSGESASYVPEEKFPSLGGRYSPSVGSMEPPYSLHSNNPSAELYRHTPSPYYCLPPGAACCTQCPQEAFKRGQQMPMPGPHLPYGPFSAQTSTPAVVSHGPANTQKNPTDSIQLSLEQRKVFVTYEADSEDHVLKVINFVALLRHNGFDTHIDMFQQQVRSISKIDFMERYLSEKEYLIIIIISPRYYDAVTASPFGLETDERTFNTVYIHKQLQNEFIQNGSKNFRFIPIIFPGARKCHVPTWLQNTHVFTWPRDLDDILRRLMRVENNYQARRGARGQPRSPRPAAEPEASRGAPEARRGEPEARHGARGHGAPEARRGAPEARRGAPEARRGAPEARRGAPEARRGAPEARRGEPEARRGEPEARRGEPEARRGEPEATEPEARRGARGPPRSPRPAAERPRPAAERPRLAAGSPRLAAGSPRLAAGSPRLAAGSPRLAAGSPRLAMEPEATEPEARRGARGHGARGSPRSLRLAAEPEAMEPKARRGARGHGARGSPRSLRLAAEPEAMEPKARHGA